MKFLRLSLFGVVLLLTDCVASQSESEGAREQAAAAASISFPLSADALCHFAIAPLKQNVPCLPSTGPASTRSQFVAFYKAYRLGYRPPSELCAIDCLNPADDFAHLSGEVAGFGNLSVLDVLITQEDERDDKRTPNLVAKKVLSSVIGSLNQLAQQNVIQSGQAWFWSDTVNALEPIFVQVIATANDGEEIEVEGGHKGKSRIFVNARECGSQDAFRVSNCSGAALKQAATDLYHVLHGRSVPGAPRYTGPRVGAIDANLRRFAPLRFVEETGQLDVLLEYPYGRTTLSIPGHNGSKSSDYMIFRRVASRDEGCDDNSDARAVRDEDPLLQALSWFLTRLKTLGCGTV